MQDALFNRNIENRIVQFGLGNDISGNIYYINNSHNVPRSLPPLPTDDFMSMKRLAAVA
jgi:hypothetical protein